MNSFPRKIALRTSLEQSADNPIFTEQWNYLMDLECHHHPIWESPFIRLLSCRNNPRFVYNLASVWAINMVHGSYCFPRYVAAIAARADKTLR